MDTKIELYHDNFQNFKRYNIPKAQLVIADIPYNIGVDAYASNPMKYGFEKSYPLFFTKNYSAQVLKANMKIVGATEFAVVLYRDKLPKFRNIGPDGNKHMVFNWFPWERDNRKEYPKIHPTQKPVGVLKRLIEIFTDPGDVVIDPVAGSGTTLRAAYELGRNAYGFEVDKNFYIAAMEKMIPEKKDGAE